MQQAEKNHVIVNGEFQEESEILLNCSDQTGNIENLHHRKPKQIESESSGKFPMSRTTASFHHGATAFANAVGGTANKANKNLGESDT